MNTATIQDIEHAVPENGTLIVLGSGVEVVFATYASKFCDYCIFGCEGPDPEVLGTKCAKVWCGSSSDGGQYIPKMKYLELKLLGEIA